MRCAASRFLCVLILALAGGCSLSLPLSSSFLVVDKDSEELRAISADDARVVYRVFDEEGGDVTFWAAALKKNLVEQRGYVLHAESSITGAGGREGREMLLETTVGGRHVKYLVSVFVEPRMRGKSRVHVVEYVAEKTVFDAHLADVRDAVRRM